MCVCPRFPESATNNYSTSWLWNNSSLISSIVCLWLCPSVWLCVGATLDEISLLRCLWFVRVGLSDHTSQRERGTRCESTRRGLTYEPCACSWLNNNNSSSSVIRSAHVIVSVSSPLSLSLSLFMLPRCASLDCADSLRGSSCLCWPAHPLPRRNYQFSPDLPLSHGYRHVRFDCCVLAVVGCSCQAGWWLKSTCTLESRLCLALPSGPYSISRLSS